MLKHPSPEGEDAKNRVRAEPAAMATGQPSCILLASWLGACLGSRRRRGSSRGSSRSVVFGGSTFDVGYGNRLNSTRQAKTNYPQYCIDFSGLEADRQLQQWVQHGRPASAAQFSCSAPRPMNPPAYLSLTIPAI
ncbi:hypothetical protein GUJ93_ZPchr0002g24920 [Zizania palustris]|uniref:Uncharacterized protein n=1 Tax=Zizania palustris TaxID=103762 RepID=A0A8J5RXY1_ZIZPA|nr:hypothetical protein GUJ93_ZPchr0002g24920 [Zizania palustris]